VVRKDRARETYGAGATYRETCNSTLVPGEAR
jgi:hypothetical protein